jgi:hypothetical protein
MRTFVAVFTLLAASSAAATAQPAQRCSTEIFPIGGQSVSVTVCAAPADGSSAAITETVKGAAKSFNHATSIDVLPGAVVSRSVDDLSLSPLDLRYTLHLTLAYRGGAASIEHALLLPGAVPLK